MKELINANDKYKMNWIEGNTEWGTVKCHKGISVNKTSSQSGDIITERYTFTNTTDKDIFTSLKDISIYTPFNDDYTCGAKACMTTKCHTHIWCGENISYVMCLRMGGEAPHLGLVLTDGSLSGYSVERDFEKTSNDRGDFIRHRHLSYLCRMKVLRLNGNYFGITARTIFTAKLINYAIALSMFRLKISYCSAVKISI